MSFGGSVFSMIISLKNNANILPKRKTFRDRRKDYNFRLGEALKYKELPKHELLELKAEIKRKIKKERLRSFFIRLSIIFIILIIAGFLMADRYKQYIKRQAKKEYEMQIILEKKQQDQALLKESCIVFYLNKGDAFFNQKDYFNAIEMYNRAMEYDAEDYRVLLACTKAYIYECVYYQRDCEKASDLLNDLKQKFGITIEIINLLEFYNENS